MPAASARLLGLGLSQPVSHCGFWFIAIISCRSVKWRHRLDAATKVRLEEHLGRHSTLGEHMREKLNSMWGDLEATTEGDVRPEMVRCSRR